MVRSLAEEERIQREVWGLRSIPFPDVPPDDPQQVARFFVGRDDEIARARSTLYRGENVLIRGAWGIGKTAFILATLHRLQQEARSLEKTVLPVYIKDFRGGPVGEFYQAVRYGLTGAARRSLWDRLRAMRPQEFGIKVFSVLDAKWKVEDQERPALERIEEFMKEAEKDRRQLVVAVDDLDKITLQQGAINTMLRDALHLLRDRRCAFVLTGRPITRLDDLEISQLGIVDLIVPLEPLSDIELRQVAVKQLNLVREKSRDDVFPFTNEVIAEIATKSLGYPRSFNRLCKWTLDAAVKQGYEAIGLQEYKECYQEFQEVLSVLIPPDIKRILYHALRKGGFLVSSKEETLDEVLPLVGVATVYDLLPYLDRLVQADYMVRVERAEGIRYMVAPGAERAAAEGEQLR